MSRRDAAAVLAMCSWARKQISKVEERAKAEADVTFPDEKVAGVVGGQVVSYTSRVVKRPELKVLDEFAFVGFVAQHWPSEIVQAVRPAFLAELHRRAIEHGVLLGPGGEVCEAVELDEPTVYTMTRLAKCADEVLEPLLAQIPLSELPTYIGDA